MTETEIQNFLIKHIYNGLAEISKSDDMPIVGMFKQKDFNLVLKRARRLGIGIVSLITVPVTVPPSI